MLVKLSECDNDCNEQYEECKIEKFVVVVDVVFVGIVFACQRRGGGCYL